jgi:hypothetical protein
MLNKNNSGSKHTDTTRPLKVIALCSTVALFPTASRADTVVVENGAPSTGRAPQEARDPAEGASALPAAQVDSQDQRNDWLSLRPSIGVGRGDLGVGMRLGAVGEYWFSDYVGVGLEAALFGQSTGLFGPSQSATVIVPALALRSNGGSDYLMGTVGAGFANVTRDDTSHCGLFYTTEEDDCGIHRRYRGYALGASVGYVGHPGRSSFELSPVARLEAVSDFVGDEPLSYLLTFNLEFGFGLSH